MTEPRLILGRYGPWWRKRPFALTGSDISVHKHVMGLTGQGKSKFLASLFVQLVSQGIACALVDPHSDLADDVLGLLARQGHFNGSLIHPTLLHVDFSRRDRFLPFNILKSPYADHDVAMHVVEVCKRVWPSLAGGAAPMFENVMLASALTLIQNGLPITEVPRLITDKRYRDMLLANVTDPQVVHFFRASFDNLRPVDQLDQAQSSLRRVFLLTFSQTLRYSLGQTANALDFRALMDGGVSAIYDLGGLDEETQKFLGAIVTVGYEVAALSRADIPLPMRRPHHLILDEFSMFSATSEEALARILSLARKYALTLTMAHQTWSQVSSRLQGALQNTTSVAFKLGRSDAEWVNRQMLRVDPRSLSHREDSDTEGVGMNEQREAFIQELTELKPRYAYVKAPGKGPWPHHKPITRIQKVKTLPVPSTAELAEVVHRVKEEYAARLLTRRGEVEDLLPGLDTEPEPPPRWG